MCPGERNVKLATMASNEGHLMAFFFDLLITRGWAEGNLLFSSSNLFVTLLIRKNSGISIPIITQKQDMNLVLQVSWVVSAFPMHRLDFLLQCLCVLLYLSAVCACLYASVHCSSVCATSIAMRALGFSYQDFDFRK